MRNIAAAALCAAALIFGNPLPGLAQDILTTHRLSAALAAEAVAEAVAACAKQGYKVTATILDADTVEQATLVATAFRRARSIPLTTEPIPC